MKAHMIHTLCLLVLLVGLGGCGAGTSSLDVAAPPDVDVRRASIRDDGSYRYVLLPERGGTLGFSLSWEVVITPEHNPAILSGQVTRTGTYFFETAVEAGREWERAAQYRMPKGDVTWGTLEVKWID